MIRSRRKGQPGPLPNFFVIGAAKAGSTTVSSLLADHPDVYVAGVKETYYFLDPRLHSKGLGYYSYTFFKKSGSVMARGDSTPSYLYSREVVARIAADLPAASHRFIVILRDPVNQVYSNYWHMVRAGVEKDPFQVAIRRPVHPTPPGFEWIPCATDYLGAARYGFHLARWQEVFSANRFHVLLLEDLVRNPAKEADRLAEFLEIPPFPAPPSLEVENLGSTGDIGPLTSVNRIPAGIRRPLARLVPHTIGRRAVLTLGRLDRRGPAYPDLDPETAEEIRALLAEDVLLLEALIGRDLTTWRAAGEPTPGSSIGPGAL